MKPFPWTCPFCSHNSVVTESNFHLETTNFAIENIHGRKIVFVIFIVCPSPECKEFTLTVSLYDASWARHEWLASNMIKEWNLIPASEAKVFPSFVPSPILNDYQEACLIKDLSPKASATLSRRCLQGMIRDFWGFKKPRLIDEIEALNDKVDPLTWKAIDAVRTIGNIGAHMEKDINQIIEVEPNEVSLLINLIETLIKDWYINRHEREKRLETIIEIGSLKKLNKKNTELPQNDI